MKTFFVILLALITLVVALPKLDVSDFGERAVKNLNQVPVCAQICILNPKWARIYAPEISSIPFGKEYGKKLCENSKYQDMLDGCFKKRCSEKNRTKVTKHLTQE